MRIVLISDTHGLHRQLDVPSGDLLIHAGDFTFDSKPPSVVSDFNAWLGSLPHHHKVGAKAHCEEEVRIARFKQEY